MEGLSAIKYQLCVADKVIKLLLHARIGKQKIVTCVEAVPFNTGASIPGLRRHGKHIAQINKVKFEDLTL